MPDPEFQTILRPNRSFAVRPTTRRPLTMERGRLRRQRSEIKGFGFLLLLTATEVDSESGPKPGSGFLGIDGPFRMTFSLFLPG